MMSVDEPSSPSLATLTRLARAIPAAAAAGRRPAHVAAVKVAGSGAGSPALLVACNSLADAAEGTLANVAASGVVSDVAAGWAASSLAAGMDLGQSSAHDGGGWSGLVGQVRGCVGQLGHGVPVKCTFADQAVHLIVKGRWFTELLTLK